jgi:hypothetical protein
MLDKIDPLCAERDRFQKEQAGPTQGKVHRAADGDRAAPREGIFAEVTQPSLQRNMTRHFAALSAR